MKQAVQYAFAGVCDATLTAKTAEGVIAAAGYADAVMTRYIVEDGNIRDDLLTRSQLKKWVDGVDPLTGERRGRDLESPVADLILDATINAPKSFSIAAMLDPELAAAYEDLQDRLRDRIIKLWQTELNARRGKQGCFRENLTRIEVVELRHERSRSLDPHKHRHLWLNVKVQGQDRRWSNIDTRVALRFQNVVNAEGDLASRTDPAWLAALAAKGFTLNSDGEIAQLQHLVRPLSKRSAQIEANKAARIAEWKESHPEQEPSREVLNQIDRWAWAYGRPDKPNLDARNWAKVIRSELLAADPSLAKDLTPTIAAAKELDQLDLDLLAAKSIVDADARSTGTGGRFSEMDIRAGVIRALSGAGSIATRSELEPLIEQIEASAAQTLTVTLLSESGVPRHVKHLMATSTAVLKATVARRVESVSAAGAARPSAEIEAIASIVEPDRRLDRGQSAGAGSIAGTSRSVAISGAAGSGKTTMLKVAGAALRRQGRHMIIVAPTKKASAVAGRATGSNSSSLHQLLHDFGWRWIQNSAGGTDWLMLRPGELDPTSGRIYEGARTVIKPGDRIVVDEAGMLDLEAANALVDVLLRTGAGVAVVGDERQALPVGHSGAMALFWSHAADQVELVDIHRFRDSSWADLTLRLRDPQGQDATRAVADELVDTGHVTLASNEIEARQVMVSAWFDAARHGQTIALVTSTHAEAQEIGESIQARRISAGALDISQAVSGQEGQAIFVGDIVQTRRNDNLAEVQNRQNWAVKQITSTHVVLASATDSSDLKKISHEYAGSHLHLGYASTVYGVQGETTDRAVVGPGVDASGLYVGLTRGRAENSVVVVAASPSAARAELVEMMQRQVVEDTIEASRVAARTELNRAARPVATTDITQSDMSM
ncbi:AAA family ATPase [Microbacterium sp. X-17]|uniref:AAA family ATPase n=1 Tax=Microbacterium sp. X-17 TaxID=3144404 RepID=UPI0031F4CB22